VFPKLCRITQSSSAHRTESVLVMGHKPFAAMSSTVSDWRQQNFFDHILFWSEIPQVDVDIGIGSGNSNSSVKTLILQLSYGCLPNCFNGLISVDCPVAGKPRTAGMNVDV